MSETIEASPLCWPVGRKRTSWREGSKFKTSFAVARDEIVKEVERLAGRSPKLIISTNLRLRQDGLPLAGQRQPDDTGVAVYFTYRGKQVCFACDRWKKIEDNMHAIRLTIEALRGIARWGTGDMMDAAFTGFTALPAPAAARTWRSVLGFLEKEQPGLALAREFYRSARSDAHPDRGGSTEKFNEVERAWEQAQRELS